MVRSMEMLTFLDDQAEDEVAEEPEDDDDQIEDDVSPAVIREQLKSDLVALSVRLLAVT